MGGRRSLSCFYRPSAFQPSEYYYINFTIQCLANLIQGGLHSPQDETFDLENIPPGSDVSQFPLALSPKTKRTRSYTSCESTHVTSGVNTRQTPSNLTGIRTTETTAWQLDALSSRDRRGSGRRGLSRRSGRVDILDLHQGR
jgi:hypothetical protein